MSRKINVLLDRPNFVQINEMTEIQRKIRGTRNISSDLSTAIVDSFPLEPMAASLQAQHENHMTAA